MPRGKIVKFAFVAGLVATAGFAVPHAAGAATPPAPPMARPTLSGPGHHVHVATNGETDVNTCADNVPPGVARCLSRVRTAAGITPTTLGNNGAYDPAYLQSAYNAPSSLYGTGRTVAIVDAYDDPTAEADLAAYRSAFSLSACTTQNGCFHKVDENGGTSYPSTDANWALEIALDVDMASAMCPKCNILLVEANSPAGGDLFSAENEAAALGASVISDSWAAPDFNGAQSFDSAFQHPGIPIFAASGDWGYGAYWPASSPSVIAVGGTSLSQVANAGTRNATETAWNLAGSGCSVSQPKPSWQTDTSCSTRTISDISADADPATGVWVYENGSWMVVGGTSAATPIVASMFALAAPSNTAPGSMLYSHANSLNDITSGSDGSCSGSYLCTATAGYDGPTGLGTPNGLTAMGGAPVLPTNSALPAVTGMLAVSGGSASAGTGTWTGSPTVFAYQWSRCDAQGANCADIDGATQSSYAPLDVDLGATLRVKVTATNGAGASAPATSNASAVIVEAIAPRNTAAPDLDADPSLNQATVQSAGTWSGSPETSHAVQWQRCDNTGHNCVDIDGATDPTYTWGPNDVGLDIRFAYSKTNAGGTGVAYSFALTITELAPENTAPPSVSGVFALSGGAATAHKGTWAGTATITYGYQWSRCDEAGDNCANIGGATASTYTPVNADLGATLRVAVTATNGVGSSTATSDASPVIVNALAPQNTVAPTIAHGTGINDLTFHAAGTWTGSPASSHAMQWQRCDAEGENCADIDGQTANTYSFAMADLGSTIRLEYSETNTGGTGVGDSAPWTISVVGPIELAAPTIDGTVSEGRTLTGHSGTWDGSAPMAKAFQWQRCTGSTCTSITSATHSTYVVASADVGHTLRLRIQETNSAGTTTAYSTATVKAVHGTPLNTALPAVTGAMKHGSTLTTSNGSWRGTATIRITAYRWLRCDATGAACVTISGATSKTYILHTADVGHEIRSRVYAMNAYGTTYATANATAKIT